MRSQKGNSNSNSRWFEMTRARWSGRWERLSHRSIISAFWPLRNLSVSWADVFSALLVTLLQSSSSSSLWTCPVRRVFSFSDVVVPAQWHQQDPYTDQEISRWFNPFLSDVSKSRHRKLDPQLIAAETCFSEEAAKTWRIQITAALLSCGLPFCDYGLLYEWLMYIQLKETGFWQPGESTQLALCSTCASMPLYCCLSLTLIHAEICSLYISMLLLLLVDTWQMRELPACLHLSWWELGKKRTN